MVCLIILPKTKTEFWNCLTVCIERIFIFYANFFLDKSKYLHDRNIIGKHTLTRLPDASLSFKQANVYLNYIIKFNITNFRQSRVWYGCTKFDKLYLIH